MSESGAVSSKVRLPLPRPRRATPEEWKQREADLCLQSKMQRVVRESLSSRRKEN
jgi:hypothetical protein